MSRQIYTTRGCATLDTLGRSRPPLHGVSGDDARGALRFYCLVSTPRWILVELIAPRVFGFGKNLEVRFEDGFEGQGALIFVSRAREEFVFYLYGEIRIFFSGIEGFFVYCRISSSNPNFFVKWLPIRKKSLLL